MLGTWGHKSLRITLTEPELDSIKPASNTAKDVKASSISRLVNNRSRLEHEETSPSREGTVIMHLTACKRERCLSRSHCSWRGQCSLRLRSLAAPEAY